MISLPRPLYELYLQGGPILVALLMCSCLAWALAFRCLLALRSKTNGGFNFGKIVINHIHQGEYHSAINICHSNPNILGLALLQIITPYKSMLKSTRHSTRHYLKNEVSSISSQLPLLGGLGSICPLLGLLGTVMGMTHSFSQMPLDHVNYFEQLSLGISQALITTQAGLIAGIPIIILHQYIRIKLKNHLIVGQQYLQQTASALTNTTCNTMMS